MRRLLQLDSLRVPFWNCVRSLRCRSVVDLPDGMPMSPDELRVKLRSALADPRRRQLAHIAVLEVAMAVREALERAGLYAAEVEVFLDSSLVAYPEACDGMAPRAGDGGSVRDLLCATEQVGGRRWPPPAPTAGCYRGVIQVRRRPRYEVLGQCSKPLTVRRTASNCVEW